jgi:hypothetical protein
MARLLDGVWRRNAIFETLFYVKVAEKLLLEQGDHTDFDQMMEPG